MDPQVLEISSIGLVLALLSVVPVLLIYLSWRLPISNSVYAVVRMLAQLLLIGYFLVFIFDVGDAWLVLLILAFMVLVSSWIAMSSVTAQRALLWKYAFAAVLIGGGLNLALILFGIIDLRPWYYPRYTIPLAGMVFANAMSAVSLAAERFVAERERQASYVVARDAAMQAAMIPMINALLAVGLVSLPGMMTGQILSGVSPLIAARYQIVIMCMLFSSAGLASAIFLWLQRPNK